MVNWHHTDPRGSPDVAIEARGHVLEVHLEALGSHSWREALVGALLGAGGGPLYRFVTADPGTDHHEAEHAVVGASFPLMAFQDLNDQPDDWANLARKRLRELDAELVSQGWQRRPDRGQHWWSLRYERHPSGDT